METTAADRTETNATPGKIQASPEKHGPPQRSADKFADARRAKKKQKRARHRAKLKRSHTGG
jgi:hypothetical protein